MKEALVEEMLDLLLGLGVKAHPGWEMPHPFIDAHAENAQDLARGIEKVGCA